MIVGIGVDIAETVRFARLSGEYGALHDVS